MFNRFVLILLVSGIGVFGLTIFNPATVAAQANGSGDVVTQTVPDETVADKLVNRAKASWPWYVTRASGMVAAVTLVILLLSGIGQVTGYTFKLLDPLTAWASHRAIAIACGISIFIHIFSLLFDKFVGFNIFHLFVPWLSNYKPAVVFGLHLGSFWVAMGVIAFYLVWLVIVTSLLWVEKKPHIWKLIHLISYLIIAMVFVHALYLGTDLSHGIWRIFWYACGIAIALASIHRLWRAKTV